MAYQTVDAVRAMEASAGVGLDELRVDGGATANAWMLQFQADLLGVPVVVPEISETTALGAAYLAGVATGIWSESDVRAMWAEAARYEPRMGEDQREELIRGWQAAVATTRNHSGGAG
jgi:glycerol kinase